MLTVHTPSLSVLAVGVGDERLPADWTPYKEGGGRLVLRSIDASVWVDDTEHNTLVGALTRIINAVEAVPGRVRSLEAVVADNVAQLERTQAAIGAPFPRSDELRDVRHQVTQLRTTLEERYADTDDKSPVVSVPETEIASDAVQDAGADRIRRKLDGIAARSGRPDLAR